MEELIEKLIESVNNLSEFSWSDFISLFSLIGAWITIFMLIKDKLDNRRPYLQITFELVRDNLACIVLRNVGNVPLEIKKLHFDDSFIKQLPEQDQIGLNDNALNKITIFPNRQWILSLGVIIPDILEHYELKMLSINYSYSKLGKRKQYSEKVIIDFKQYSRFLVYISELNELNNQSKKLEKELKMINKELKKISTLVQYANVQDKYVNTLVSGYEEIGK